MSNKFPMSTTGRIATDPELTTGRTGTTRMTFRLAVNDRTLTPDGTWVDAQTVFYDVIAFGESAKTYADTFRRGDPVGVVGDLRFSTYTTRDGENRTGTQIVASFMGPDPRLTTVTIDRTRRADRAAGAETAERTAAPATAVETSAPWPAPPRQPVQAAPERHGVGL